MSKACNFWSDSLQGHHLVTSHSQFRVQRALSLGREYNWGTSKVNSYLKQQIALSLPTILMKVFSNLKHCCLLHQPAPAQPRTAELRRDHWISQQFSRQIHPRQKHSNTALFYTISFVTQDRGSKDKKKKGKKKALVREKTFRIKTQ